jgi:enamine deaminase RidA (YjgF/YER057c/UK114 family)
MNLLSLGSESETRFLTIYYNKRKEEIKMNKKISLIHSINLAQVDYAYAGCIPAGMDILFFAGACPLNKDGEVTNLNDYAIQAKLCIENLQEALKECGASLEDVVYTRVLVATGNQSDLVTAWRIIRKEFGDHDVPSTLSGVTVLGYKNQLVEIEAVAAVESLTK